MPKIRFQILKYFPRSVSKFEMIQKKISNPEMPSLKGFKIWNVSLKLDFKILNTPKRMS